MDKHKCKICNEAKNTKGMSMHLRTHNLTWNEYLEKYYDQYPNEFPTYGKCEVCNKVAGINGNKWVTCSMKCSSEYRKTLTGKKAARYGKTFTEEQKQNISEGLKGVQSGDKHWNYGKTTPSKTKDKIASTRKKLGHGIGPKNGMYGKTHTAEAVEAIFKHRKMNKLEKLVADVLDEHNIKYTFQFFIKENNIGKSYDFKIKGKPIIIEVDGDFWHGHPDKKHHWKDVESVQENDKFKTELAKQRGYTLYRYWESDIKNNPSIVLKSLEC